VAKVICSKHGIQFGMMVCGHVNDAIETNRHLRYTPSSHPDIEGTWLCDQCVCEFEKIRLDSDLDAFLSRIKPPCVVCARAWERMSSE
jgi:hypothetical protein